MEQWTTTSIVLAVFPVREDQATLREIFATRGWRLHATATVAQARLLLSTFSFCAVITESSFPDGRSWRDLLFDMHRIQHYPPLIVADRLADDRLWAEVLNLGAHDLLSKPFDCKEVLHAVSAACSLREHRLLNASKLVVQEKRDPVACPD